MNNLSFATRFFLAILLFGTSLLAQTPDRLAKEFPELARALAAASTTLRPPPVKKNDTI